MIANRNFTECILKWIEMALSTCGELQLRLHDSSPDFDMQEYLLTVDKKCDSFIVNGAIMKIFWTATAIKFLHQAGYQDIRQGALILPMLEEVCLI